MAYTVEQLIRSSLMKAGVVGKGRPSDAFDTSNALEDLNDLIAMWESKRWMNWTLLDLSKVSTGAAQYTIGPGGDFDTPRRPDRLKAAYVRQLVNSGLPINTPLEIIPSREEYSRLSLPTLVSFPLYLFLDTAWPLGVIKPYPLPNASIYEIHVIVQNVLTNPVALDTNLDTWPSHYVPALKYNLALVLRQAYGKGAKPDMRLEQMAKGYMDAVIDSNLQVPELVMPKALITQSSGYNILSDQFGNG